MFESQILGNLYGSEYSVKEHWLQKEGKAAKSEAAGCSRKLLQATDKGGAAAVNKHQWSPCGWNAWDTLQVPKRTWEKFPRLGGKQTSENRIGPVMTLLLFFFRFFFTWQHYSVNMCNVCSSQFSWCCLWVALEEKDPVQVV